MQNLIEQEKEGAAWEDLIRQDGLGELMVQSLLDWVKHPERWQDLQYLLNELQEIIPAPEQQSNSEFSGKTIVFTGKLTQFSRAEAKAMAERMGAKIGSAISSKTDFLVCGEDAGSKLKKAQALNIKIFDEAGWLDLIESTTNSSLDSPPDSQD